MPTKELRLRIGPALKWAILQRTAADPSDPMPGITSAISDNEEGKHLALAFYDRERLPSDEAVMLIEAEGLELLITEEWICDMLNGKQLDIVRGKLTVLES